MTFKKNWLSILVWIPFALAVFVAFGVGLYENLPQLSFVTNEYLQITFTVIAFILAACVFIALRKLSKQKRLKNAVIAEAFLFAILLGVGILCRCFYLQNFAQPLSVLEEAAYFDTAKVTGGVIPPIAHGAQYFYVLLLRGLFWLFGNHFLVGIILQIVLQGLSCIIWYIAIRKISGSGAALLFLCGMMFLPKSILSGMTYSPKYFYLLLAGFAMMFLANVLRNEYFNKSFKWYTCIPVFLTGAYIGLLVYMDIAGFLFFIPVVFLLFLGKNRDTEVGLKQKIIRVLLKTVMIVLGAAFSFYALIALDAWQSGNTVTEVAKVWLTLFAYKGVGEVPVIFMHEQSLWAYVFILFLLVVGVFAFFARKRSENQLLWMFMLLAGFVIHFGGFYSFGMNCDELLLFIVLALTGAGVQAATKRDFVFVQPMAGEQENTTEKESDMMYQEFNAQLITVSPSVTTEASTPVVPVENTVKTPESVSEVKETENTVTQEKPGFIENPLPLPKKHVKKTMDYGIEIPPEQMEFDIQTSDMDDFDVL